MNDFLLWLAEQIERNEKKKWEEYLDKKLTPEPAKGEK